LTGASEPFVVRSQAIRAPQERQVRVSIGADGAIAQGGQSHVSPPLVT
jgi:hypothetical protein